MLKKCAILLLMLAVNLSLMAQERTVSGTVNDSGNAPIPGVSVFIKGTTSGTVTDINGKYSVSVPSESAVLVYSFIGMKAQEIVVGTQSVINITLGSDLEELDEIVVVGYGVQKKKLLTGATSQMKGDEIVKQNSTNTLQAMQGQVAGVTITSTSGQPGASMNVTIRGLGTVGNAAPLYLIDGIGGDISTLNPSDIESIDVLKDAASAAIYGAQAANGVILVTTKKGKEGKSQVTFDAYYGVQNVARKIQMLNADEYMTIMDEARLNSGNGVNNWASLVDKYDAAGNIISTGIYDQDGNVYNTNWLDEMFVENAVTQNYNLGISGGTAISTYSMTGGYTGQEGIVGGPKASSYDRYNFRINSEHKLYDGFLTVGENVSLIYKETTGVQTGNQYNNTLRSAFGTSPLAPIYNAQGEYNNTTNSLWNVDDGNPYAQMMTGDNLNQNASVDANAYAQIEPIKNLKIKTVYGISFGASEYRSYTPIYKYQAATENSVTKVDQSRGSGLLQVWTNTANYDFKLNTSHAFNALVGMEMSKYDGGNLRGYNTNLKNGFDSWSTAYLSNTEGTESIIAEGKPYDASRTVSYFARLGWNFNETYMVNATFRADGSSKFAPENRFGYFPSVSAGWTISNMGFMEGTKDVIDFMKIRASWGQVGNQNIKTYQYLAPVTSTNTNYNFGTTGGQEAWITGAYPSRLANEKVKWETSEQLNFGLDVRFLNNKLGLVTDYYIKNTKDWLVEAPILATAGAGPPIINGGDVKNTGVELALNWSDNISKDLSYYVGFNGAYNKNEVGKIPTSNGIIQGEENQIYNNSPEFYRASNGHPIGYFWGYKTAGIFQNEEEISQWIAAGNGVKQTNVRPGDVKYYDVNHDGVINTDDKVDLGCGIPEYTFGFNFGLNYKGFDFGVTAAGAAGFQIVQSYRNHTSEKANYSKQILNRWTGEGTSNKMPRVTTSNINWEFSDLYIQDGDYLRISNVTIGYDFSKLANWKYLSQARVYVQGQNLLTFTKYDGMDPEIGSYNGNDGNNNDTWVSGVDLGYYPHPRTILVGINLKF
jgi:TonB-dependent starch-binding outer membrane protein SusC